MSALPKLNATPKYEMVIPSTGKTVMFRPYLVKEEKILMMAFESKDEKAAMQAMLDTIDVCVEGDYVKNKLTTFDIEYMFTQIRGKSVGESINVKTKCSECETENDVNIILADIKVDVPEVDKIIPLTDTISLEVQYPPFKSLIVNQDKRKNETEMSFILMKECMAAVINGDERVAISEVPEKEVNDFVDSLNTSQIKQIGEFVEKIPVLKKDVEFECSSCKHHNKITLQGIQDFFT